MFTTKECEWSDLTAYINGKKAVKLRGVKYKYAQENELLYAAGNKAIGVQTGNVSCEGELKLLKGDVDDLNRAAQLAGYDNICNCPIQVVMVYRAVANRPIQTDTLVDLYVSEFEKGMEQGAKMMEISLPFKCLDILVS